MGKSSGCQRPQVFDPDTAASMSDTVEEVWQTLRASGHVWTRDMRVVIARLILDLAAAGERDPARLRDAALASFFLSRGA